MTTSPICSNQQPAQQPPPQAPSKSPVTEATRAFYKQIRESSGVLSSAQELELHLQETFTEAYTGLIHASVRAPGKSGRLDQLLAEKLGWVRWLWQKEGATTAAGGIRQALVERSNRAADLIRTYTQFEALPTIRELDNVAREYLEPIVGATKARELLYDHIVVGQTLNLRNVSDNPITANVVYQRYLAHYEKLRELDPSLETTEALDAVVSKLQQTTDAMAKLARDSGVQIETLKNGGYGSLQLTQEFENYLRATNTQWLSGFGKLKEKFQKARMSNLPVVANLNELTSLLQGRLLKEPLPDRALLEYSAEELKIVEAAADVARGKAEEVRASAGLQAVEQATALEKRMSRDKTKAVTSAKRLLEAKDKGKLAKLREQLKSEPMTGAERKAVVAAEQAKLADARKQKLVSVESKWNERLDKRLDRHWAASAKTTETDVAKVYASQSKDVQQLLNFERAKLTLADISTRPGELNRFLHENFSGEQLQRMFDTGLLDSLPATADELTEFYKTVDVGVRGLSDAIMLDPVAALKAYSEDLAKAASDHALFKTAFDEGSLAGWVVDEPPQGALANYIKVGESTQLQKYLGGSGLPESAAELYIHKQAASALDSLLQINTRASNLASASSAWQTFTRPFRRMLLMSSGLGYVTRVFTQGLLATYSATGSIAQLPFAMVDALRLLDKGFKGLPSTAASFKVGGTSYTSKQLFQAMLGARGGHALASMQEPSDLLEGTFRLFDKGSRERTQHFNQLYTQKYGEPLTGTLQSVVGVAGEVFGASYRALAFSNQFLDMTFRWAVVRELASSPQWAERSFEELMRHTDNYFSINADAGSFGNFVGQALSPFAQFALNAPGAALRHAIAHPWRTGNIMTMYATASGSSSLSESELPEWLKDNETYFFTMAKDPDTGKHFAVVPGSVDFMLDSYTWMAGLARDIAGIDSSTAEAAARASNPFHSLQKQAAALLEKTYFYDAALALMNVDPQTLKPYELGAEADTVLGVPTTKGVRSLLTNLVPLVRTLDQSLPASVVGQAPSTKLVAQGSLRVTDNPGTPSWTGAVPSQGGARRNKGLPPQAAAFQALTGLSISDIDPQRNIIGSYKDLDTRLREVRSNANALYSRLAQSGSQAAPSERKRYQQLKDLELVLLRNKEAIDVQALATGRTPPVVFESLQGNFEQLVTKPIENDTLLRLLEENKR